MNEIHSWLGTNSRNDCTYVYLRYVVYKLIVTDRLCIFAHTGCPIILDSESDCIADMS